MNNLISVLIGALIALMVLFNGSLSSFLGNYQAGVIIHFVGLVATCLFMFTRKIKLKTKKNIPFYMYMAGVIGVITVMFNNIGFVNLGASLTLAIGLLGQTIASIVCDHFGLLGTNKFKFEKKKFIGLAFIVIGIGIMNYF